MDVFWVSKEPMDPPLVVLGPSCGVTGPSLSVSIIAQEKPMGFIGNGYSGKLNLTGDPFCSRLDQIMMGRIILTLGRVGRLDSKTN